MKTIFQDSEGEITELNDKICETLLCVQVANEENNSPGVFWLKIQDGDWHRFFLDKEFYFLVWTVNSEIDKSDLDDEDFPVIDIGERYKLKEQKITKIFMRQIQEMDEQIGCLTILFSEGDFLELKQSPNFSSLQISNLFLL